LNKSRVFAGLAAVVCLKFARKGTMCVKRGKLMQQNYQRRVRIIVRNSQGDIEPPGLLGRVAAAIVGAIALVVAFMFSVVALAVVSVIIVIVSVIIVIAVGYLWWKTRDLRRQLRENPPGGRVIDGDSSRDGD
jgi:Flp pilus assembly protein TadB